jgi:uncharacterized membrane-anchored protein
MANGVIARVDKLRRIWTPRDEVRELADQANLRAEADSIMIEALHALVENERTVTIRFQRNTEPISFERVLIPGGLTEITLWAGERQNDA